MEIKGYKAFSKDHTNRYGMPFEEGKDYHVDGPISFGNNGNGFHMCTHLSDVFRYFDPEDIDVAEVIGSGKYVVEDVEDWSEPYWDMYVVSDIHISRFLNREEIIDIMKDASSSDIIKFFATSNPTKAEGLHLVFHNQGKDRHDKVISAYMYYIEGVNVYGYTPEEREKIIKGVIDNGQDNNQGSERKQLKKC